MTTTQQNELPVDDQSKLASTSMPWDRKGADGSAWRNLVLNEPCASERLLPDAEIIDKSARWGTQALLRLIEEREFAMQWDPFNNHYRQGDRPILYKLLDEKTIGLVKTKKERILAETVAATIVS